jgi:cold shock CspA family protein
VTALNVDGFGFIAADRHAGEIWIRPRSVKDRATLREGQRVEYAITLGTLGIEAADVRSLDAGRP